jgi:hypothetical protein
MALTVAARKFGQSPERLGMLQFLEESMKIHPVNEEVEKEFRSQALDFVYRKHLGVSQDEARAEWQEIRPEFLRILNWVISKRGIPVLADSTDDTKCAVGSYSEIS